MTDDNHILAVEGVRFFGEMSASISHEMKNVLAIVNENAGLLNDMVQLSEQGMPLAAERLAGMAQSISRQVQRGDRIVKRMNRFAHSADHPRESVDVGDTLGLVNEVASRLIAMRGAPPQIDVPAEAIRVRTHRFFLENLIWNCLCRLMDARGAEPQEPIRIQVTADGGGARIRFRAPPVGPRAADGGFPSSREQALCRLLGARLSVDATTHAIEVILP